MFGFKTSRDVGDDDDGEINDDDDDDDIAEYGDPEAPLFCGGALKEMELFGRIFMLA